MLNRKGFTVIELVMIITVIAIIGGGSYSLYQGRREQALASIIWADLGIIEGSLTSTAKSEGVSQWWTQSNLGSPSSNPTLETVSGQIELRRYLAKLPEPKDDNISDYLYDNEGDTYNPTSCNSTSNINRGVNIRIRSLNGDNYIRRTLEAIDDEHDDGNGNCGKVTVVRSGSTTTLYYHLAINSADYPSTID